ncbi:MAG: sigma-54-dependent Fis family transcriptional regulator, partial [Lentisphaerae bacterium]|nr:sigma-54-dependent Fis family transcriptional regulator [Lentisphaerota bacterium]
LSDGNAAAATRIIELRRQRGNASWLDDFFLSRASAITRQTNRAAKHFAEIVSAAEKYKAEGRLRFELRLSSELPPDVLFHLTHTALSIQRIPLRPNMETPVKHKLEATTALDAIIGTSKDTKSVRDIIRQFAPSPIPVLITGETGTGKELVAHALHDAGPNALKPFVTINCGAIAESLLESELFGHSKGAFSGAGTAHIGLFEQAEDGTILLDEIGDISPRLQIALLRVLETSEIRPVGSAESRKLRCRIIASTNADLSAKSDRNEFRRDLLFRLRRLEIHLTPLRSRSEDILPLVAHFLDLDRPEGTHAMMSERLIRRLTTHPWPGNVRELKNTIERMRLMNSDKLFYDYDDFDAAIGPLTNMVDLPEQDVHQKISTNAAREIGMPENRPTPAVIQTNNISLHEGKSRARRLARLRILFQQHRMLTRSEIAATLGISPNTATADLNALVKEKFIDRIQPSASPRSVYFVICDPT